MTSGHRLWPDQIAQEGLFYRVPTEVAVHAGGREIRKFDDVARGDQWDPEHAWDDDDLIRKARDYTEGSRNAGLTGGRGGHKLIYRFITRFVV
jgi:hypothetical protein